VSLEHPTGFKRLGVLSQQMDKAIAMRPFDAERNGTVIGEGAGALVMERVEHAVARGAPIYGYVAGGGDAMDAHSLVEPLASGRGIMAAMQRAILASEIDVCDIGHINAHGTSTRANDAAESRAIAGILGRHAKNVPITSSKPYFGHTTAASGVLEAIVTLLSMKARVIHPMPHTRPGADVCPLDYLTEMPRAHDFEYALSNSAGIGGFNACVILTSRQSAH
jgi:3-oxoacyl-[acyl-carrier-protein] synthase II